MSLTHKSRLKPGGPLRRRSKNKKAVCKLGLGRVLSEWVCASPCIRCGRKADHAHHVLTRGAWITLLLCWLNIVPLCWECHAYAHANVAAFKAWFDSLKPGILDYLKLLNRTLWSKRDLCETKAEIASVTKRPWHERWAEVVCK